MSKQSELLLGNIVMDSIRILLLISKFDKAKNTLNIEKIMMYDYYLKYPNTMIGSDKLSIDTKYSFYEYYAFFHWKPNISEYNKTLSYLLAKGLISKELRSKEMCYIITEKGLEVINSLKSSYKNTLLEVLNYIKTNVTKMKDSDVEKEILHRTSIKIRFEGDKHE